MNFIIWNDNSLKKIDSLWLDLKKCFLLLAKLLNCERTNIIGAWCQKAVIISNIDRLQIIVTHAEYNIVVYYNRALILFLFAGNAIESNETTQSFMKVKRWPLNQKKKCNIHSVSFSSKILVYWVPKLGWLLNYPNSCTFDSFYRVRILGFNSYSP